MHVLLIAAEVSSMFWVVTELGAFVSGVLGLFLNSLGVQTSFYILSAIMLLSLTVTLVFYQEDMQQLALLQSLSESIVNNNQESNSMAASNKRSRRRRALFTNTDKDNIADNNNNNNNNSNNNNNNDRSDASGFGEGETFAENGDVDADDDTPSCRQRWCTLSGEDFRQLLWPFKKVDFLLALSSSFFLASLEAMVQWFSYYYFRDRVAHYNMFDWFDLQNAETAVSVWLVVMTLGGIVGAVVSPWASQKLGHKTMVLLGAFTAVLAPVMQMFLQKFDVAVLLGFVFGGGMAWANSG
jgi:MFS family permease